MTEWETLRLERVDGLAILWLNRPRVLNAVNLAMLADLNAALDRLEAEEPGAVILTGAGERAFVVGGDIAQMRDLTAADAPAFVEAGQLLGQRLERFPRVVIAAINGYCLGGGLELALACDVRLAAEGARLGLPEVGIGLIAGWGGTQRLARLVGPGKARWLAMSGEQVDASTALRLGLVEAVVPADRLLPEAQALGRRIASNAPVAVRETKRSMVEGACLPFDEALRVEREAWLRNLVSVDRVEGLNAFLERRPPRFTDK
ncbi:MAG: enoyl-CoA hydratase/isomerase family protein [Chloroflexi bacterium]|nr:enoyl-CoA hydratase/isomerase family protein [Chloroflexota bacterium]